MAMAAAADAALIGLGDLGPEAPLRVDGFLTAAEIARLVAAGAVGEILGHAFDIQGRMLPRDDRVASAPLPPADRALIVAAVHGPAKRAATLGALRGGLVNGVVCDQDLAAWLLRQGRA